MNADDDIRIVIGNDHSNPLPFHLANVPPVASCLALYALWILNNEFCICWRQLPPSKSVLRMPGEVHALPKGAEHNFSPPFRRGKRRF